MYESDRDCRAQKKSAHTAARLIAALCRSSLSLCDALSYSTGRYLQQLVTRQRPPQAALQAHACSRVLCHRLLHRPPACPHHCTRSLEPGGRTLRIFSAQSAASCGTHQRIILLVEKIMKMRTRHANKMGIPDCIPAPCQRTSASSVASSLLPRTDTPKLVRS